MKQAGSMKNLEVAMALPGVLVNPSPDGFAPFSSEQRVRFDGKKWARMGDVIGAK